MISIPHQDKAPPPVSQKPPTAQETLSNYVLDASSECWNVYDTLEYFAKSSRNNDLSPVLRNYDVDVTKLDEVLVRQVLDIAAACCVKTLDKEDNAGSDGNVNWEKLGKSDASEHGQLVEIMSQIGSNRCKQYPPQKMPEKLIPQAPCTSTVSSSTAVSHTPPLKAKLTGDKRLNYSKAVICRTTALVCNSLFEMDDSCTSLPLPYSHIDDAKVSEQAGMLAGRVLGYTLRWFRSKGITRELEADCARQFRLSAASKMKSIDKLGDFVVTNPFMTSSVSHHGEASARITPPASPRNQPLHVQKMTSLLDKGNNLIYCDPEWNNRFESLSSLFLRNGLNLLITSTADMKMWMEELEYNQIKFMEMSNLDEIVSKRDTLLITTWLELFDTVHLARVASLGNFDLVLCDYGIDFMGIHATDPNSLLGKFWENLFLDSLVEEDIDIFKEVVKDETSKAGKLDDHPKPSKKHRSPRIGILNTQRIITGNKLATEKCELPSGNVLSFFCRELMEAIKEEWDRCRFSTDAHGFKFVQKCIQGGVIYPNSSALSLMAHVSDGLPAVNLTNNVIFTTSRAKHAIQWVSSRLAEDLNAAGADIGNQGGIGGWVCCEVIPGSFSCGALCKRRFSNEAGLRQHRTAMHAPRGTWLCRSCGGDCITSQARTQHERYCGDASHDLSSTGAKQHGPGVGKRGNTSSKSKVIPQQTDLISTSSVVPALSVINIKDLPPHIKPLLRDPRQTARTGGGTNKKNKERYIYAYRGVCRQARKGHDRWQSQISFGGTNHYLGTFDSEWDAAAVYAWAHWILYGKEATLKAQKEGEEAAASWEREKKLIAEGKLVPGSSESDAVTAKQGRAKKRKTASTTAHTHASSGKVGATLSSKKAGSSVPTPKTSKKSSQLVVAKAPVLLHSLCTSAQLPLDKLLPLAIERLTSFHEQRQENLVSNTTDARMTNLIPVCQPVPSGLDVDFPTGFALLMGLSATQFNWSPSPSVADDDDAVQGLLQCEYGLNGTNDSFFTIVRGNSCILGQLSFEMQRSAKHLGMTSTILELGGPAGIIDCNVGGPIGICAPMCVRLSHQPINKKDPSSEAKFSLTLLSEKDIVTVNGQMVRAGDECSVNLFNGDIISVGPRVFLFSLPSPALNSPSSDSMNT